jgi:amino acid adenylation domain-containing protein
MNNAVPVHAGNYNIDYASYTGDPKKKTLNYYIDESAERFQHNTAIKFDDRVVTYRTLVDRANQLSWLLKDNGTKKGDIIGVAVDRSPEMVICLLAIMKCGAAYLPVDPEYPKERVAFMLGDSSAKILLTSKKYRGCFQSQATELLLEDAWIKLGEYDTEAPGVELTGDDIAYILYTSGSTGKPKGVIIRHYNLVNCLLSLQKMPGINSADKFMAITTISFDIAGIELFLPLICGAQIVLVNAGITKDGLALLDILKTGQVTFMQATPYTYRMLLAAGWNEFLPVKIIAGGEALPKDLVKKLLPLCDEIWNQYGPTETTIYSTQKLIKSIDDITIGTPIDNTEIYILDPDFNVVEPGSTGEIYIAGDGVAKGYLNRPELTADKFIDNPFSDKPGAKIYRSGDLGRVTASGDIQCLGRIDHQVKLRGFRVELEELEYALLSQHNVKEAVAIVRNDVPAEPRLTAYIVLADAGNERIQLAHIRTELAKLLPSYMIPDDFVPMTSIAVTPNGKIDRQALPKPAYDALEQQPNFTLPCTPTEVLVKGVWEQQLGIKNISITGNFFSLGGHSLVAVKIMARIKKLTGKQLPLATLFENSTIEKLSARLDCNKTDTRWYSLVPIKPGGSQNPLYIIHGDGLNVLVFNKLATCLDEDQPVYGLQALGLEGGEWQSSMKEIAAAYVAEIIDQNPSGPYLLAGYSLGGYIAVEIREQLAAMGKKVKMLIIFDTDAEKSEYQKWYNLFPKKLKRHVPKMLTYLKTKMVKFSGVWKNAFVPELKKGKRGSANRARATSFYDRMEKIKREYKRALNNYSLNPFDDTVHLFKARICTHYVDDTEFLGWGKYARRGVIRYDVPGDHLSILNSPNVEKLAEALQASIDQSAAGNP